MLQEFATPPEIKMKTLDQYLSNGWYRMGPTIFTTDFLFYEGEFCLVIWLRYRLSDYNISKSYRKLQKLNKSFTYEVMPFQINEDYERLYQKYILTMPPGRVSSLSELLYGNLQQNVYDSFVVNLFDGNKLIGVGIFDLGEKSAAGIATFYDPDYKKHSPGRYIIFSKISYCMQHGFEFFYPGYVVAGVKAFDYKLGLGGNSVEFYDWKEKDWKILDDVTKSYLLNS